MANSAYLLQKINTYFGTQALFGAISSGTAGTTAGTEPSGGAPAYARKAITWGTATTAIPSVMTATATVYDIPSGFTVLSYQNHDAVTAGNFLNSSALTSQLFSSQGTYTVNATNNES